MFDVGHRSQRFMSSSAHTQPMALFYSVTVGGGVAVCAMPWLWLRSSHLLFPGLVSRCAGIVSTSVPDATSMLRCLLRYVSTVPVVSKRSVQSKESIMNVRLFCRKILRPANALLWPHAMRYPSSFSFSSFPLFARLSCGHRSLRPHLLPQAIVPEH